MKYIKFKIKIPKKIWIYELSNKFPEDFFKLNYSNPISKDIRSVFISSKNKDIETIRKFLEKNKQIKKIESIGNNLKITFKLDFLIKLVHHKLTIIFPVIIHNGYGTIEILGNEKQLKLFEKVFGNIKILKISNTINKKEELTEKQNLVLETAHLLGYFTYPRKITLTELSKYLKMSKSSLSESLRIAENKIINNYFLKK